MLYVLVIFPADGKFIFIWLKELEFLLSNRAYAPILCAIKSNSRAFLRYPACRDLKSTSTHCGIYSNLYQATCHF